ncbi:MAG: hypothetical protein AAGA68_24625 [Pseudomonadota bacterium]
MECRHLSSQDSAVTIELIGQDWDYGLSVQPGDRVRQTIVGIAD